MFCKNCGTEIQENAKFCSSCGAKIEFITPEETTQENVTPPAENIPAPNNEAPFFPENDTPTKKKSKKGLIFGIIGAVVVIAVALILCYPYISNFLTDKFTPEEKYYQSVEKKNAEEFVDGIGDVIDNLKEEVKKRKNSGTSDYTYDAIYSVIEALPSGDKTEKILTKYIDVIFANLGESEKEKDEIYLGDKEIKVTRTTVTLNESDLEKIALAITKEVKEDKELRESITDAIKTIDPYTAEEIELLYDDLDDKEIEEEIDGLFDGFGTIEISAFVNSKSKVIGRELKQGDTTLRVVSFEDGNEYNLEIIVESEDAKLEFSGSGKTLGDKFTGKFTLKSMDQPIFNIKLDDLVQDEEANGKFTLELSKELTSMLPMIMDTNTFKEKGIDLSSLAIVLDMSTKNGIITGKYSIVTGEDTFVSVEIKIDEDGNVINLDNLKNGEDDIVNNLTEDDLIDLIDALPYEVKQVIYGMIYGTTDDDYGYDYDYDYGYDYDYDYGYDYDNDYDYDYGNDYDYDYDYGYDYDYEEDLDVEYGYDVGGNGYNVRVEAPATSMSGAAYDFAPSILE